MPNITQEMVNAMTVKTNDGLLATYVSGLCRAVIALHDLINNKIENRDAEKEEKKENKEKKENEKKEKEGKEEEDKENKTVNKAEKKK